MALLAGRGTLTAGSTRRQATTTRRTAATSARRSAARRRSPDAAAAIADTAADAAAADAATPTPTPTRTRRHSLAATTAAAAGLLALPPPSPAHAARNVVVGPGGAFATDPSSAYSSSEVPAVGVPPPPSRRLARAAEAGDEVLAYEHGVSLAIVALRGSVPAQWVLDFRRTLGKFSGFSLDQRPQLEGIFDELEPAAGGAAGGASASASAAAASAAAANDKKKKNSAARADVVTVGDAWLAAAVRRGLVQPIPGAQSARWWRRLPERWKAVARRDPATGAPSALGGAEIYACPYRWGAVLVAYKKPVLERRRRPGREHLERALESLPLAGALRGGRGRRREGREDSGGDANDSEAPRPIRDWSDLLQPALRGRVAFSDSPRELVGIALKTLGLSFNATAADARRAGVSRDALKARVAALKAQARLYSARDHVRALGTGDVDAVVGTSADLVPLAERAPTVALVAPRSGTVLWADLWAVPSGARGGHLQRGPAPTLPSWLEFCTSPARVGTLGSFRTGATPLLLPPEEGSAGGGGLLGFVAGFLGRKGRRREGGERGEEQDEPWRLSNRHGYLPPRQILARSEFLGPLDPETAELYAYALGRGG